MRKQVAAMSAAREREAAEAEAVKRKLADALHVCQTARDECGRVRRRNEQVERELIGLKERMGEPLDGTPCVGIEEVFKNLGQIETMVSHGR